MAVVEELIRSESDGAISFGNHKLEKKAKVEDLQTALQPRTPSTA